MQTAGIKRLTIFAGHYGSGKTLVAVNYARYLKPFYDRASLFDLDIVNPYFRAADFNEILRGSGIECVSSPFANTSVDIPALPAGINRIFDDPGLAAVIDIGGDDRGATALGGHAERIEREDYEMLLVVNVFRPQSRNIHEILQIKNDISLSSRLPFTGIINNANLGASTSLEDIYESIPLIEEVSAITGLPVKFASMARSLCETGRMERSDVFPMDITEHFKWELR